MSVDGKPEDRLTAQLKVTLDALRANRGHWSPAAVRALNELVMLDAAFPGVLVREMGRQAGEMPPPSVAAWQRSFAALRATAPWTVRTDDPVVVEADAGRRLLGDLADAMGVARRSSLWASAPAAPPRRRDDIASAGTSVDADGAMKEASALSKAAWIAQERGDEEAAAMLSAAAWAAAPEEVRAQWAAPEGEARRIERLERVRRGEFTPTEVTSAEAIDVSRGLRSVVMPPEQRLRITAMVRDATVIDLDHDPAATRADGSAARDGSTRVLPTIAADAGPGSTASRSAPDRSSSSQTPRRSRPALTIAQEEVLASLDRAAVALDIEPASGRGRLVAMSDDYAQSPTSARTAMNRRTEHCLPSMAMSTPSSDMPLHVLERRGMAALVTSTPLVGSLPDYVKGAVPAPVVAVHIQPTVPAIKGGAQRYELLLSQSDAIALTDAIKRDPRLIDDVVGRIAERTGAAEDVQWAASRPLLRRELDVAVAGTRPLSAAVVDVDRAKGWAGTVRERRSVPTYLPPRMARRASPAEASLA